MNVKLRILLSIIVLTVLGAVFIIEDLLDEIHHKPEYTAQSSAVYTDDFGVFFMENWNEQGRIYRVDSSGKVLAMTFSGSAKMDRAEKLAFFNGKLYALFSSENEDSDGTYPTYRIVSYDEDLKQNGVSGKFTIDSTLTVCSLTADTMCLYISALAPNGGSVSVFSIPLNTLKSVDMLDDDSTEAGKKDKDQKITREDYDTPDPIVFRERTTERFYVNARYVDPELYVLLDGDTPEGVFKPDTRIKTAVDSISFSFGQKIRLHAGLIIKGLGMLAIWLILVTLAMKLTKDRDRIVYLFLASVVVFLFILFVAFIFIRQQFQRNEMKNNSRFALMVMQEDLKYYGGVDYDSEDFYESTKYYRLMDSLKEVLNKNDDTEVFYDVFVMRKSSGVILADAKGHNGIHASYLYGGEMSSLIDKLKEDTGAVSSVFTLEGDELTAVAYESENPNDDLALVAICKDRKNSESFRSAIMGLRVLFIVVFLIGSVLLFVALYLQHMDLKKFSTALKGLALGGQKVESPQIVSKDMRELWQSYGELSKKIEEINYEKYRIFEAYYRFAPKGIEQIMGKESILDVEIGDVSTITGTIALLTIDKNEEFVKKVESLSAILSQMERYNMESQGVLISRDQALSNVRFLLMKEKVDTVSNLVQFIHNKGLLGLTGWSVLMYRDMLQYGVAGSKSQCLTYIDSEYSRKMDAYADWFRKLEVPLVVTDLVLKSEDAGETRFVGCAAFDGDGNVVRFYEVLDAYAAGTRQLMLINRTKFQETLELYYSKNFYLARNQFMEILKDCPEDGIVRWYIFECEKYMNNEGDVSRSGYIEIGPQE